MPAWVWYWDSKDLEEGDQGLERLVQTLLTSSLKNSCPVGWCQGDTGLDSREWGGDKVFVRWGRGGRRENKMESMEEDGSGLGELDGFYLV